MELITFHSLIDLECQAFLPCTWKDSKKMIQPSSLQMKFCSCWTELLSPLKSRLSKQKKERNEKTKMRQCEFLYFCTFLIMAPLWKHPTFNLGATLVDLMEVPRTWNTKTGKPNWVCYQPKHINLTTFCLSPEGFMHALRINSKACDKSWRCIARMKC